MQRHYLIIGLIVGLGALAAFWILTSTPTITTQTNNISPTATPNPGETLHGNALDGQLIFSRKGYLWSWRGSNASRLPIEPGKSVIANGTVQLVQPALSPDGSKLAYIRQDETFADLWVAAANGSGPRILSADRGNGTPRSPNFVGSSLWSFSPNWSPDNSQIAFLSDVGTDDLALWVTSASNFSRRPLSRTFAMGQGGLQRPSWSPKGDAIAVAAFENGKTQIYSVKTANGAIAKLSDRPEGAYDPAWSPDGKYLAFVGRRGNASELWLMQADGGNPVLLTNQTSRTPAWSPDGKRLAFAGLKDNAFELFTLDIGADGQAVGSPHQISTGAKLDGVGGLTWGR